MRSFIKNRGRLQKPAFTAHIRYKNKSEPISIDETVRICYVWQSNAKLNRIVHTHIPFDAKARYMCMLFYPIKGQNALSSASNSRLPSSPSGVSALVLRIAEVPSGLLW